MADQDAGLREVIDPQAPLRRPPAPDAPLDTEALKGERVVVHETNAEAGAAARSWTMATSAGCPPTRSRCPAPPPTHKVSVPRTLVFPGPSIKQPPREALSLGCRLAIARIEAPFAITRAGGCVPSRHLGAARHDGARPGRVAERFLGVPYLGAARRASAWIAPASSRSR